MGRRLPRPIWAAPLAAVLVSSLAATGDLPSSEGPAVRSISGRLDGELSTVLIESTEPVAYLTSQPDPLTVFVDLRNARADAIGEGTLGEMPPPVSSVRYDQIGPSRHKAHSTMRGDRRRVWGGAVTIQEKRQVVPAPAVSGAGAEIVDAGWNDRDQRCVQRPAVLPSAAAPRPRPPTSR